MKIYPLYSSSSGNLFCLEDNNTNILIDVGVSYKNIVSALKGINKSFDDIDGILITHEHSDHCKGINLIAKKHNSIPIYTCSGTKTVITKNFNDKGITDNIVPIKYNELFNIANLNITAFKTSHDALEPCGFNINNGDKTFSLITDSGFVDDNILSYLYNSDYIVLESNYDKVMLEYGNYPFKLKSRIKSDFGHLSNDDASDIIINVLENSNKDYTSFLISHLSYNNNTLDVAKYTIFDNLNNYINSNIDKTNKDIKDSYSINFASRDMSFEEYEI